MKKNVLVVDDSALMRRMMCDIINDDERFNVMNKAIDGEEALGLLRMYDYDAVVLDVNMPKMDGIELLRQLQKYKIKARVMMASTFTTEGAKITMDALELGALDFIHKPDNVSECRSGAFKEEFLRILAAVAGARIPTIGRSVMEKSQSSSRMVADMARKKAAESAGQSAGGKPQATPSDAPRQKLENQAAGRYVLGKGTSAKDRFLRPGGSTAKPAGGSLGGTSQGDSSGQKPASASKPQTAAKSAQTAAGADSPRPRVKAPFGFGNKLVAIASSTGGPKALQPVLTSLPKDLSCPVVLVQHMPKGFTKSLAERLDAICELTVREAGEGEVLRPGNVYIARGGAHMNVVMKGTSYIIHYTDEPPREGVKPCANYMYESLRASAFEEIVCVVMTGMGADGTDGIQNLKKTKKVHVIVQEKDTCAVYGMPKSVVSAGLADDIVPLDRIAQEIIMNVGVK